MRRIWYILSRCLLALFLVIYVATALVNYSVVQSLAGALAGRALSERCGGTVRIGSLAANPFDHALVRDAVIIDPAGDTVAWAGRVSVRFNGFPFRDHTLRFGYAGVEHGGFHLAPDSNGVINLQFFINLFAPEAPRQCGEPQPFTLSIRTVVLKDLRYHHDLPGVENPLPYGADIPHLDFYGLDARIHGLTVDERGRVTCQIQRFACRERRGLNIQRLEGDVDVGPEGILANNFLLQTDSSHLEADVALRFRDWKTTKYWCDSVDMYVLLKPGTELSMATAAYWAPTLWGMDTRARVTGVVRGPVAAMRVQNLSARFGRESSLVVEGSVTGLPAIERTRFDLRLERLATSYDDLCAVRHPDRMQPVRVLPLLKELGHIDLIASLEGGLADARAQLSLSSALGGLSATARLRRDGRAYAYRGEVASPSLQVGRLLDGDGNPLGATGFSLAFDGRDFNPRRMVASLEGRLFNTVLNGQRLAEATLDAEANSGLVDLELRVADTLLRMELDAKANITTRKPFFQMRADIARADLGRLGLWQREGDTLFRLASLVEAQATLDLDRDDPLESLDGALRVSRTRLQRNHQSTLIDGLMLSAQETRSHRKRLSLTSDLASAEVRGYFSYRHLPLVARHFCEQYVPAYYNPFDTTAEVDYGPIADASIVAHATWTDSLGKSHLLLPSLRIAHGSHVDLNYHFAQSANLAVRSDSLRIGALGLARLRLLGREQGGCYRLECQADALRAGQITLLEEMRLDLDAASRSSVAHLLWDNLSAGRDTTCGDITLFLTSTPEGNRLAVGRHRILLGGQPWTIGRGQGVLFGRKRLETGGLDLTSDGQSLHLFASLQGDAADSLSARFASFRLDQLQPLLGTSGFALGGTLDGTCALRGLGQRPMLDAGVEVADFVLNDQPLGDLRLDAAWNADSNRCLLDLTSRLATEAGPRAPVSAKGYVDLAEADPSLHFDLALSHFTLQAVAPLAAAFASQVEGYLDGALALGGTLAHPLLSGALALRDASLHIDALNQDFSANDLILFSPDTIRFSHFTLLDPQGNRAVVDGAVALHGFSDMDFSLDLHTDRFWVMNTTASHHGDFYGSVFAAADGHLAGNLRRIDITATAVTASGSRIFFPISNRRQVKEMSYIRFGLPDDAGELAAVFDDPRRQASGSDLHVAVDLAITPDVVVGLPTDLTLVTADVAATGQGELRIALEPGSDLDLRGTYEIGSGSMDVTLAGVYPKRFSIEQGSSIEFRGALSDVVLGIDAVYSQRVNLATLTGVASSSDHSAQTINVQDVVQVTGPLSSPSIGFDIRLPNADQSVEEEVFSYIDRNNEREMLNQCVSLLVAGQFFNANVSNSTNIEASGISLLTNALGGVVSGLVSAVDINFDYNAATELTRSQFDVGINKDFDRLYLESTLGVGGIGEIEGPQGNELTGDVLLGYKLRPNVHFFVFNRSNTNDYTRNEMPYKQGAGIKLTKDFDRIGDLFKKKKK